VKSPSAQAYERGVQIAAAFSRELNRCRHPQAEPVVLTTGELVACVCIGCYQPLPAEYIEDQSTEAQREAYCRHVYEHDITGFDAVEHTMICSHCGRMRTGPAFPNLRAP
jgi:hypothetical protein